MLLPRATGETVASEKDWFFRRDGSMFPVSYVSAPIELREGRGAVVAFTDIEDRLRAEQVLREHDAVLATQQASLRRVASLVAGGATSADVFAAIAREAAQLLGMTMVQIWRYEPDGTATILGAWSERPQPFQAGTNWRFNESTIGGLVQQMQAGRPVRVDDFAKVPGTAADAGREMGITSAAGAPIVVDGELWGLMTAGRADREPVPDHIEDRLADFTELVATAISNTASREELARLADEQAALRRVATLVARGVSSDDVFAAVGEEIGVLLRADAARAIQYVGEDEIVQLAGWSAPGYDPPPLGRIKLEGTSVTSEVLRTRHVVRIDDYASVNRVIPQPVQQLGIRSAVGAPIVVDGRLWGAMLAWSMHDQPLPHTAEARIADFTELVATALANAQARAEVERLAEEQAAPRRVATLVAEGVPARELLAAVAEEAGTLLDVDATRIARYEDGEIVQVAGWSTPGYDPPSFDRAKLEGTSVASEVLRTGRVARIDDYESIEVRASFARGVDLKSVVGAPIAVEGRRWGVMIAWSTSEALPADAEARLTDFTELVATAIANTEARAEVERLAEEQAALRRVATLIAREASPAEVFAAVAEELGGLLDVGATRLVRYEQDETATIVSSWGRLADAVPTGTRMPLGGVNIISLVAQTGRPARIDDYAQATGPIAVYGRRLDARGAVGGPIVVAGRVWGAMIVSSRQAESLPAGTEGWIEEFAELVATAIANVQGRSDLAASRARIVAVTDEERRRVVRDLHDGAQQRLVHTVITLKLARRALQSEQDAALALVTEALDHAQQATDELRELAHGILPAVLTQGGLRAGVDALASRMPVPVENGVSVGRLPAAVEATAYFVVAEALTNIAKHARAGRAEVTAHVEDGTLRIQVRDDGIGGARPDGNGLLGLADRLAVLDGQLLVESPADGGTLIAADLTLPA